MVADLTSAYNCLKPTEAPVDPVPGWFLVQNLSALFPFLQHLLQQFLDEGVVPEEWKLGIITPLSRNPPWTVQTLPTFTPSPA